MKKIVALLLICCMVLPMISVSAADTMEPKPTIEEILNKYHENAFEAQSSTSHNARSISGNGQTPEQEAVDSLTDAGYEAYYVTADNREALESALQTDFAELGITDSASYIMVISGEDPGANTNSNARVILPPTEEDFGDDNGGGGSIFYYTVGSTTYTMRYVTLTAANNSELESSYDCSLTAIDNMSSYAGDAFYALARLSVDSVTLHLPNPPEISFLYTYTNNQAYVVTNRSTFKLYTRTNWTRSYIQVWNEAAQVWKTCQCSTYAYSYAQATGNAKHRTNNTTVRIDTPIQYFTTYSPFYNYPATRKDRAVQCFVNNMNTPIYDTVGNVGFYFSDASGATINTDGSPLIIHEECLADLLPIIQEG